MSEILIQGEYILRLFLAALCGGLIGYERKHRMKEAGIRTHLIVALGSALIMIVSKYGFFDLTDALGDVRLDPSRVASQIVSGVSFLGAGMIFVKRQTISGLTTAAGIWATAGVGMAVGAGVYTIGIASSVIIFVMQGKCIFLFIFSLPRKINLHSFSSFHFKLFVSNPSIRYGANL